ncbi:3-hydroxylacyl-ACP dehydratase [Spirochaetia bacterium]|nr:3-hydroxylacyl-ACP dehydratase [Spirochaetia bacterium]
MDAERGIIETKELLSLIPHKGKMVLLSRLLAWDLETRTLRSEFDITGGCLFYDPALGGIPGWASFECMAQSISALTGLQNRRQGKGPKIGFILSISNMDIAVPVLPAGTTIQAEVRLDCSMDEVHVFDCRVSLGDRVAVTAKMTVMETADTSVLKNRGGDSIHGS